VSFAVGALISLFTFRDDDFSFGNPFANSPPVGNLGGFSVPFPLKFAAEL
jgi:hypothetical protein